MKSRGATLCPEAPQSLVFGKPLCWLASCPGGTCRLLLLAQSLASASAPWGSCAVGTSVRCHSCEVAESQGSDRVHLVGVPFLKDQSRTGSYPVPTHVVAVEVGLFHYQLLSHSSEQQSLHGF